MATPNQPNLYGHDLAADDDSERVALTVSDADQLAFDALPARSPEASVVVTDMPTGTRYRARRWPCPLECYCAAAFVRLP
jgi:hypothetical protein